MSFSFSVISWLISFSRMPTTHSCQTFFNLKLSKMTPVCARVVLSLSNTFFLSLMIRIIITEMIMFIHIGATRTLPAWPTSPPTNHHSTRCQPHLGLHLIITTIHLLRNFDWTIKILAGEELILLHIKFYCCCRTPKTFATVFQHRFVITGSHYVLVMPPILAILKPQSIADSCHFWYTPHF